MSWLEDLEVGALYRHARAKTVTDVEGQLLCHLVMNTAQGHFNEHLMAQSPFGSRIVFGGIVAGIVIGLAMQDTAGHAVREVGMDKVRFSKTVRHGDTLSAYTEVLSKQDDGLVTFRHWGVNQDGEVVFEAERCVLVRKRP